MEWRTRITELLGIKYPIIEGAFGSFGKADLAAAVSEAGGLGMITANALRTPEKLRREIRRARTMTDKPFAVNLSPLMHPGLAAMREVAIEERVPVIETAGFRSVEYGRRIKEAGLIWLHKVTTVRHAITAEQDGADAVCIVGLEGVGFKNPATLPTLINIPMAVKQIKIPVIAAGGIGDARGFLAALAMGAEAVLLGTVFMAVKECPISERRKQALVKADPYDPKWRDVIIHTPTLKEIEKLIEVAKETTDYQAILRAVGRIEGVEAPDSGRDFPYPASLAVGFIDGVVTAKELINNIIKEAEEILTSGGLAGWKLAPKPSA
jgi:nitronate monooxygenase